MQYFLLCCVHISGVAILQTPRLVWVDVLVNLWIVSILMKGRMVHMLLCSVIYEVNIFGSPPRNSSKLSKVEFHILFERNHLHAVVVELVAWISPD